MDALRIVSLIAANDFRLTLKSRSIILYIFALPLVFMLFFGATFKGESGPRKAGLGLENRDGGFVSKILIDELRKEPLEIVDTMQAGSEPPRTLVIPEGFTDAVLGRAKATLIVRSSKDANLEAGEAVSAAVARCVMKVVSHLIEIESGVIAGGGKYAAARTSAAARGGGGLTVEGDSVSGSLLELSRTKVGLLDSIRVDLGKLAARPPLVTVSASSAGTAKKIPSGFQASVPGSLVMFVLMTMVFSGIAVTVERSEGVLRRFAYAPTSKACVLLGKLCGRMGIAILQIAFLLAVGRMLFHVPLGGSPAGLALLMISFAFCAGSFGILFGALFRNPEQVSSLSVITTLTMAALGGCWWPIEIVSRPFRIAAMIFPTGWAMSGIHKFISFGYGIREAAPNIAVLVMFGLLFILVASWKLKWTQ
jgi:ABC-type multidrug transport system permease subunit